MADDLSMGNILKCFEVPECAQLWDEPRTDPLCGGLHEDLERIPLPSLI